MPQLFPSFPEIVIYDATTKTEQEGYAPAYAFEGSDFVLDGAGRIVIGDGEAAWRQWCMKALCTQRGAYAAYGDNFGIEGEEALQEPTMAAVQSHLERTIVEALMQHPYTTGVRDFTFTLDENNDLQVTFIVEGKESALFDYSMNFSM